MQKITLVIDGVEHTVIPDKNTQELLGRLLSYQRNRYERRHMTAEVVQEKRDLLVRQVRTFFPGPALCSTRVKGLVRRIGNWHLFDVLLLTRHEWYTVHRCRESTIEFFQAQIEGHGLQVSTHIDAEALVELRGSIPDYKMPWELVNK